MTDNIENEGEKARERIEQNVKQTVAGMQTWFIIGAVAAAIFTVGLFLTKLPL